MNPPTPTRFARCVANAIAALKAADAKLQKAQPGFKRPFEALNSADLWGATVTARCFSLLLADAAGDEAPSVQCLRACSQASDRQNANVRAPRHLEGGSLLLTLARDLLMQAMDLADEDAAVRDDYALLVSGAFAGIQRYEEMFAVVCFGGSDRRFLAEGAHAVELAAA